MKYRRFWGACGLICLVSFSWIKPAAAATFVVTNVADAGPGSLREAIISANSLPGADVIQFAIPGNGVQTIVGFSDLPAVSDPVVIDGTTQPGYSGKPLIVLSPNPEGGASGLILLSGNCVARALCINGFYSVGVLVYGTNNLIEGCFIGTDAQGLQARPNGIGILVGFGSSHNLIGGRTPQARNVISGNSNLGVCLFYSSGHTVQGNFIGTDVSGTLDLGNGSDGVSVDHSSEDNIGGTLSGEGNVISGNGSAGIRILGSVAVGNVIEGNRIGTDVTGTLGLGNSAGGIVIFDSPSNTIGGINPGSRNVISGNAGDGISIQQPNATGNVIEGNVIGLNAVGTSLLPNYLNGISVVRASANTIGGINPGSRNVISGNRSYGVSMMGSENVLQGNLVGTDITGGLAIGNGGGPFGGGGVFVSGFGHTIGGEGSSARNVISGNSHNGLTLDAAMECVVQANWIGVGGTGQVLANTENGIVLRSGSRGNTIGGANPEEQNISSGNALTGLLLSGSGTSENAVMGNYFGLRIDGGSARANGSAGILIVDGAAGNFIGGSDVGEGNFISGNQGPGIQIAGAEATNNLVLGNVIGLDAGAVTAIGNGGSGVEISGSASNQRIGGTASGEGNRIAYNRGNGVLVRDSGTTGVTISGNSIFGNGGLAINLQPAGEAPNTPTANDPLDTDIGPNRLQNIPVITNVIHTFGSSFINGSLRSSPGSDFDIEIFSSDAYSNIGFGEARSFVGSVSVSTDSSGLAEFQLAAQGDFSNQLFVATATASTGDTSELSSAFPKFLRIMEIRRVGNDVRISFTTELNGHYAVQWTPALPASPQSWNPVSGAQTISGNGNIVTVSDLGVANSGQRFYRVQKLP